MAKKSNTGNKKKNDKTVPKVSYHYKPDGMTLEEWQIALRQQAARKETFIISPGTGEAGNVVLQQVGAHVAVSRSDTAVGRFDSESGRADRRNFAAHPGARQGECGQYIEYGGKTL